MSFWAGKASVNNNVGTKVGVGSTGEIENAFELVFISSGASNNFYGIVTRPNTRAGT